MGWGARDALLSLVERMGLAPSSLHHELGPINKQINYLIYHDNSLKPWKKELPTLWTISL